MDVQADGSVRISWSADGYESIDVEGRWRSRIELDDFAREVADAALLNRSVEELRTALRRRLGATFDLVELRHDPRGPRLVTRLHPPRGTPNPDV